MKKSLLLSLACLFLLGAVRPAPSEGYISPWVQVLDGESIALAHGIEPVNLCYVWVAEPISLDADYSVKRPWTDYSGISVLVSGSDVTVYNNAGEPLIIQVIIE